MVGGVDGDDEHECNAGRALPTFIQVERAAGNADDVTVSIRVVGPLDSTTLTQTTDARAQPHARDRV